MSFSLSIGSLYILRLPVELCLKKTLQRIVNIVSCCVRSASTQRHVIQYRNSIYKKPFLKKLRQIASLFSTQESISSSASASNDESISSSAYFLSLHSCSALISESASIVYSALATPSEHLISNFAIQSNSILGSSETPTSVRDFAVESASISTPGSIKDSTLDSVSASIAALSKDSPLDLASCLNVKLCTCVSSDPPCVSAISTSSASPPTSAEGSASAPVSSSSSRKCVGGDENNKYQQEKTYEEVSQDGFFEANHNLAPPGSDGDDNGESHENPSHVVRSFQTQPVSNNQPVIVEFPVKHFWKIAKQQNDLESSEMGRCRGFYYRLLIHPKGTAGTDSEASHLSVFLEAVRQDWFPDDWVFPNVRFELTVVNFRDPKQNVTSWAHWSFSNDAASRGWQKMLSHSRLNRLSGFVDDEGTVLIRGKAEPPYDALWSHASFYKSKNVWVPMNRAFISNDMISSHYEGSIVNSLNLHKSSTSQKKNVATTPWVDLSQEKITEQHEKDTQPSSFVFEKDIYLAQHFCDQVVPVLRVVLHADCVAYFLLILYFLKEFRREIFLWNTCHTAPQDDSLCSRFEGMSNDSHPATLPIIESLQSVFASLQLYPLVQSLRQLSTMTDQSKMTAEDTQLC
jgi:hypothetical protein